MLNVLFLVVNIDNYKTSSNASIISWLFSESAQFTLSLSLNIPLFQRDLQDNTLLLADQKFPDLMSLVNALRRDVLLENCRQLLINPCPGLPLNAIFSGYMEATARRRGRGRGRPRWLVSQILGHWELELPLDYSKVESCGVTYLIWYYLSV